MGIFACRCRIQAEQIEVGALLVEVEELENVSDRILTLYATDNSEVSYQVQIPKLTAYCTTKISLLRVAA